MKRHCKSSARGTTVRIKPTLGVLDLRRTLPLHKVAAVCTSRTWTHAPISLFRSFQLSLRGQLVAVRFITDATFAYSGRLTESLTKRRNAIETYHRGSNARVCLKATSSSPIFKCQQSSAVEERNSAGQDARCLHIKMLIAIYRILRHVFNKKYEITNTELYIEQH